MFANLDAANRARDKVRTSLRERARRGGMGLGRRARDPLPAGVRNAQVTLWQPECRVRVPSHGASRVLGRIGPRGLPCLSLPGGNGQPRARVAQGCDCQPWRYR